MKVTEAINKALNEHGDEVEPTAFNIFGHCGNTYKACAQGLAVIGALGLDAVKELSTNKALIYRKFSELFPNANTEIIERINDTIMSNADPDFSEVINILENKGY
jgi:hypothetical protein